MKKITILFSFLLSMILIAGCMKEKREMITLDLGGTWKFKIDSSATGEQKKWHLSETDHSKWDTVKVPENWDSYGIETYDGVAWFWREFTLPETKEKLAVVFDAVDDDAVVFINETKVGNHEGWGRKFYFDITSAVKPGVNTIAVRVNDIEGPGGINKPVTIRSFENDADLMKGPFADSLAPKPPDWARNAVIYEIFVRDFSKEGTFNGVEDGLPRLKELGADILWLMPIHEIGEIKRKGKFGSPYSVKDYYSINKDFGTADDLKSLVAAAHKLEMKVIIDIVVNHTSWDSKLLKEHPEWFSKDLNGKILPPVADWWDVADLNYDLPEVQNYMKTMLSWWVTEFDLDGFRCDVAEMVPNSFWSAAIGEVQKTKPTFWLAEGSTPDLHMAGFHATYSWNIYDKLEPILTGKDSAGVVYKMLSNEKLEYPKQSLRLRFSENHDKYPQQTVFGERESQIATFLTWMLPGIPMIYNGMEVANEKRLDLFEKTDINWGNEPSTHSWTVFYKNLKAVRKEFPFLEEVPVVRIASGDQQVLCFSRKNPWTDQKVVAVMNFTKELKTIPFKSAETGKLNGLLGDGKTLTLPPYGFDYFVTE
ncbi:MAG: family 10 glycosylhydrolase [Bacteroidetes bacterium]|nr:family 10 glycosylhydrolase [Bacteroidota bacterium]